MIYNSNLDSSINKTKISGWGRRNFVKAKLITAENTTQILRFLKARENKVIITRGLGRSYGDAAQLKEEFVLKSDFLKGISISGNQVTVGGGVSISELLEVIVPQGLFLPVSPGSANVTIGGAIAADVHGKNHHVDGSFGNHIQKIIILDGNGEIRELTPYKENTNIKNNFFWATVGGMGLTGVILEATFTLINIETSFFKVDTFICNCLEELMELMLEKDKDYRYSVAWVDSLDKKNRGILTCGEHALTKELNHEKSNLLIYDAKSIANTPSVFPNGLLNRFTVKAFNELWFRKSSSSKGQSIQSISQFFHPLDGINNWNNIYGSKGFYQYQFVVPDYGIKFIEKTLKTLKENSANSFLTVLKRFGKPNNSFLSFPEPGWTLALDLPASNKKLLRVLNTLDDELAALGGKIYLAKDLRQSSEMFKRTYPSYNKWRKIKSEMDPKNIFQSDLSRRLKI